MTADTLGNNVRGVSFLSALRPFKRQYCRSSKQKARFGRPMTRLILCREERNNLPYLEININGRLSALPSFIGIIGGAISNGNN